VAVADRSLSTPVASPALSLEGQGDPCERGCAGVRVEMVDEEDEGVLKGLLGILGVIAIAFGDREEPLPVGGVNVLGEGLRTELALAGGV
jgi:hypothetical protein